MWLDMVLVIDVAWRAGISGRVQVLPAAYSTPLHDKQMLTVPGTELCLQSSQVVLDRTAPLLWPD